jgi:hypothetical protein
MPMRFSAFILAAVAWVPAGCGRSDVTERETSGDEIVKRDGVRQPAAADNSRVRLALNDKDVFITLHDNPSCRDLLAMLPLTLTLTDYAATEKIATLPRRLSLDGAPKGYDPSVGDLAYYAPWGNLAFFYKDAPYATGLVFLGRVESGFEALAAVRGDLTVRIERVSSR